MKVIIAGGRDFSNYQLLKLKCDRILLFPFTHPDEVEIVSGKCPDGADALGERYARERGCKVNPFHANWDKYGDAAGPIRNEAMAKYADCLIAFYNGRSRGTGDMINKAKKYGLKIRIIKYA